MIRPLLRALALTILLAAGCQPPSPSTTVATLDDGWEFRLGGESEASRAPGHLLDTLDSWLPASVPGTVHTDLLAQGLIQDPFWRDEELKVQWVGEEDWTYRTRFQVPEGTLQAEVVELVFHGLDTFAEVFLNNQPILEADNMFRTWRSEVKDHLLRGENVLEVRFRSPIPQALEARAALPYVLPAGNDRGNPPSRVFVRKAAYHYGWDWGPRLVTSGIWRPVELLSWSGARIADFHLRTDSITDGRAFATAGLEIDLSQPEAERRAAGGNVPVSVTLSSPDGSFEAVHMEVLLEQGLNQIQAQVEIPQPRRWWPNGYGEHYLYTVKADLQAGRFVDTAESRFGLRTLELVTEADSIGESFFFRVNGVPVFMKGANVIPLDHFSPRVTEEQYRSLFQDAVAANMNMLRVWGGGIYEEDLFYELADEHGILIWQDFMFANGMYPGDSAFLANVRAEASDQVRRLRGHPSLALWCGNNEVDEGWKKWGWSRAYERPADSAAVRDAYEKIFHEILPEVVTLEDPTRPYWPSSPSLGWGDPESLTRGDSHYWGVWHGREPFEVFAEKLPRFSSEFGFQAVPSMETVEAFTDVADRSLVHPIFLVHQKHPIGNELIGYYMARDYPVPAGFEDFAYVSQLLQARGMRTAFEAHRRAKPRTMGTLYWQLNDTWPVVSWSSRDYFGRWKALHYAAREAFAPVLISPVLKGDTVEVWGVSDLMEPLAGTLFLELQGFDGAIHNQTTIPVTLEANRSRRLWKSPISQLVGDLDRSRLVLSARFQADAPSPQSLGRSETEQGSKRASGRSALLYFLPPRQLELGSPAIRFEATAAENGVLLILESDFLAKGVQISLKEDGGNQDREVTIPGTRARFEDNFFDLLPNRPRTIFLETDLLPGVVAELLIFKTLADIPKEGMKVEDRPH